MDNQKPPDSPNTIVKLVFEQVDTEIDDIKGCRVFLEAPNRQITERVLLGEDRTVAECWAVEVFEFVRDQLMAKMRADQAMVVNSPKKEDMN